MPVERDSFMMAFNPQPYEQGLSFFPDPSFPPLRPLGAEYICRISFNLLVVPSCHRARLLSNRWFLCPLTLFPIGTAKKGGVGDWKLLRELAKPMKELSDPMWVLTASLQLARYICSSKPLIWVLGDGAPYMPSCSRVYSMDTRTGGRKQAQRTEVI